MRFNLKDFLQEIEDQSYYIGNENVVAVADVITAEKRIEAELRGLAIFYQSLGKLSLQQKARLRFIREILGE